MGSTLLETGPKRTGAETSSSEHTGLSSRKPNSKRDPYQAVLVLLLATVVLSTAGATYAGITFSNPVLLDVAVTLGLSAGVLIGVLVAQAARAKPPKRDEMSPESMPPETSESIGMLEIAPDGDGSKPKFRPKEVAVQVWRTAKGLRNSEIVRIVTAGTGVIAIGLLLLFSMPSAASSPFIAGIIAASCLAGAGLASTAVHYLATIEPVRLPEAPGLCRGARVIAWILSVASVSVGLAWLQQQTAVRISHFVIMAINAVFCLELLGVKWPEDQISETFSLDLGVLSTLGSRTNILGSVLDAAERQLGIDLRSTWALTVVRRSLEPLMIGLLFAGHGFQLLSQLWGCRSRASSNAWACRWRGSRSAGASSALALADRSSVSDSGVSACRHCRLAIQKGQKKEADPKMCCGRWNMLPTNTRWSWAMAATSSP